MWLATQHGFYSIVRKGEREFHIRARIRRDLVNLLDVTGQEAEILEWPRADYHYRVIVDHLDFLNIMAGLAVALDYPNFKGRIAETFDQREKLPAFQEIWQLMARLQEEPPS